MKLLAFIHHRAHGKIEDWFAYDREQLLPNFVDGDLKIAFNPHCITVHGEVDRLFQWEKESAHKGEIVGYPCAYAYFKPNTRSLISYGLRWTAY